MSTTNTTADSRRVEYNGPTANRNSNFLIPTQSVGMPFSTLRVASKSCELRQAVVSNKPVLIPVRDAELPKKSSHVERGNQENQEKAGPLYTKTEILSYSSLLIGSFFLFFYAFLILIQSIFLLAGGRVQNSGTLLALAGSLGLFLWLGKGLANQRCRVQGVKRDLSRSTFEQLSRETSVERDKSRSTSSDTWALLASLAVVILVAAVSIAVSSHFYDLSWDGRDYHQRAIRWLSEGWNPVYTELEPKDAYYNAWLNHYPKGPWIAAAAVYQLAGDIELGKSFNLFLMAAVFFIGLSIFLLLPQLKFWEAALLSLSLAANPVSVYQSLSYYIDGQVSSVVILILLLILLTLKRIDANVLLAVAAVTIIGLSIKFTATAYVIVLLAVMVLAHWFVERKLNRRLLPLLAAISVGGVLGLLVVGFNPYVTNLAGYGNPFYPLYGSSIFNKDYVISEQLPSNFEGQGQIEKLLISVFSRSQNTFQYSTGPLKNPFSLTLDEIKSFRQADVRIGGWGPLFGASLLLSPLALALAFLASSRTAWIALGLIAVVFATSMLNSEIWWARYSPQLWLIPVISAAAVWLGGKHIARLYGYGLLALVLLNLTLVSWAYLSSNFRDTWRVRTTLSHLSAGDEVLVYTGPLDGILVKLDARQIHYTKVASKAELPCPRQLAPKTFYSPLECTTSSDGGESVPQP